MIPVSVCRVIVPVIFGEMEGKAGLMGFGPAAPGQGEIDHGVEAAGMEFDGLGEGAG